MSMRAATSLSPLQHMISRHRAASAWGWATARSASPVLAIGISHMIRCQPILFFDTPPFVAELDLEGRDCPIDRAAAREALAILANSATARELLAAAQSRDVGLELIVGGSRDGGERTRYYHTSDTITWDPFQSVAGQNFDGSSYELSPVMTLAHELVHAAHDHAPTTQAELIAFEIVAMQVANQIARELNAVLGTSFNTTRDNHASQHTYHVSRVAGVSATAYVIARPGCP